MAEHRQKQGARSKDKVRGSPKDCATLGCGGLSCGENLNPSKTVGSKVGETIAIVVSVIHNAELCTESVHS